MLGHPRATSTGTLSPVSMDSSIVTAWASTRSRSAATRSPGLSNTRSPITTSAPSTTAGKPSRRTVTRVGISDRSRSVARSARSAWANANSPLMTTTTKMATPSCGMPATHASTPATQSISAKKWTNSAASRFHAGVRRGVGSSLRPWSRNRAAASTDDRPIRSVLLGIDSTPTLAVRSSRSMIGGLVTARSPLTFTCSAT